MKLTLKILLLLVLIFAITPAQQKGLIPVFDLHKNDLNLERIAQANQYFDRIGKKAALMGFENGSFEMWIWPWKVLRNFDLQFFRPSSTIPINASEIVRTISVTPEVTVINYSYETFSVKVIYLLPREEAAAILLLDINTAEPLTIVPGFIPVMQPQWPAGIGGQYSYWDDEIKCFIISESQQRGLFLCGSPLGEQMSAPPAHMFADNPLQFKLEIDPDECKNHYVPIIICGSPVKTKYDSVKIYYNYILNNIQRLYEKNYSDYNELLKNTINLTTPDEKINSAFRYGKIALYNLLVDNPNLGKGLVAGYGLSGGGGRPGFSWFFGGDAFINSLSLCSFQDFETVKDALRFTQKWQRQENYPVRKRNQSDPPKDIGKMAHELSQSDGLCDWWNDYHFGYNHADTTPWYLVAIGNYFVQSGDVHFIKQSWDSIVKAFDWCLSKDSDNDGLMDLKGAGLGVLEFGSLVKIHNDIYTQAVYLQGLKFLKLMAEEIGDSEILEKTIRLIPMAEKRLDELYWIDDLQFYSFGANENDQQVREKSIFSSSALMFNLLDEKKSERTIRHFNSSDMVTDWGIRNLSNNSELFHPSNYNYGTVWPFNSMLFITAQYNYYFNLPAYQNLRATLNHLYDNGLGTVPEVFSGEINQKLAEAYHNQGFSYSGFIYPVVNGLLGIKVDASKKKLSFSPKFPADWDKVSINNIRVGQTKVDLFYTKYDGKIEIEIKVQENQEIDFIFEPVFSPGTKGFKIYKDGNEVTAGVIHKSQGEVISFISKIVSGSKVMVTYYPVPELYLISDETEIGQPNIGLKFISQSTDNDKLITDVEVLAEREYYVGVTNSEKIKSVIGAELQGNRLMVKIKNEDKNNFRQHRIIIQH